MRIGKSLITYCKEHNLCYILNEWSCKNNIPLEEVSYGSSRKCSWICQLGHEFIASPNHRTRHKSGCPYCANQKVLSGFNDLQTRYPDIAKEWNYKKNKINPNKVLPGSMIKYWWICPLGHEYYTKLNNRTSKKTTCPYCSGHKVLKGFNDLATTHSYIIKEWYDTRSYFNYSAGSNVKIKWKCSICSHIWEALICSRTNGSCCPKCKLSKLEQETCKQLKLLKITHIIQKQFDNNNFRFDFYLPDYNCCIECQGPQHYKQKFIKLYSKSSYFYKHLDNIASNDAKKQKFCSTNNIKLIIIPFWEIDNICDILSQSLSL